MKKFCINAILLWGNLAQVSYGSINCEDAKTALRKGIDLSFTIRATNIVNINDFYEKKIDVNYSFDSKSCKSGSNKVFGHLKSNFTLTSQGKSYSGFLTSPESDSLAFVRSDQFQLEKNQTVRVFPRLKIFHQSLSKILAKNGFGQVRISGTFVEPYISRFGDYSLPIYNNFIGISFHNNKLYQVDIEKVKIKESGR